MSMLTPPGMGGKYRIKGDRYPRMRRSRGRGKVIMASFASVVAVAVIGWGTLQLIDIFSGGDSASASDDRAKPSHCPPSATAAQDGKDGKGNDGAGKAAGAVPEPGAITVNVLNATSRGGLAKSTADELKKRGFKIGDVGNAPAEFDKKVKKTGVLVGAPGSGTSDRLKVLGTQLDGADTKFVERGGKDVDLVIGDDFKKLTKKKSASAALAKLSKAQGDDKAGKGDGAKGSAAQPSPGASC